MPETKILSTKNTPEISLNSDGMIRIHGRSMGISDREVYNQAETWIENYLIEPADITCVDVRLEYLNSRDLKFYISFIKETTTVRLRNKKLIINWYYEEGDEDILEKGEHISLELGFPFNFIKLCESYNTGTGYHYDTNLV